MADDEKGSKTKGNVPAAQAQPLSPEDHPLDKLTRDAGPTWQGFPACQSVEESLIPFLQLPLLPVIEGLPADAKVTTKSRRCELVPNTNTSTTSNFNSNRSRSRKVYLEQLETFQR